MLPSSFVSPNQATAIWLRFYRKSFIGFCRILQKIGLYNKVSLHLLILSIAVYIGMNALLGYSNFSRLENYRIILILPLSLAWQSVLSFSDNFRFRLFSYFVAVPIFVYAVMDKNNLHPGLLFDIAGLVIMFFLFTKWPDISFIKKTLLFGLFITLYTVFAYFFQTYFVISLFSNFRPLMFLSVLPLLYAHSPGNTFFTSAHFFNLMNTSPIKNFQLVKTQTLNANRGLFLIYLILFHILTFALCYDFIQRQLPAALFYYVQLYVISYSAGNIPIAFFRFNRLKAFDAFDFPIFATSLQSHWQRWNRNYYDWLIAYVYYPVYRVLRSQFLSVMLVFIFTYLMHSQGSLLNFFLDRSFLWAGFPLENNQLLFFLLNGVFLFLNLKVSHWKIFDGERTAGWCGTVLTHFFYLSLCWLKP